MSDTNEAEDHFSEGRRAGKRTLGDALARRQQQLDALRAKATARRQKEKETRAALVRQMTQLQARERRRQSEIERDEAREVVRHLGTLALDALIRGEAAGGAVLAVDWPSIAPERRLVIERVITRGRSRGGRDAADMTADPAKSQAPEGSIDIQLDDTAT